MLTFIACSFCIHWDNDFLFVWFVHVVNDFNRFSKIKLIIYSWHALHLVIVYYCFIHWGIMFAVFSLEFCISVHEWELVWIPRQDALICCYTGSRSLRKLVGSKPSPFSILWKSWCNSRVICSLKIWISHLKLFCLMVFFNQFL